MAGIKYGSVSTKKDDEKESKTSSQTEKKVVSLDPKKGYGNVGILTEELRTLTDNQRTALDSAMRNNADIVAKTRNSRPEDTAYYNYAKAIKELTREDGTVDYDPNGYRFNPYTDGLPDETARKAYESLSYADQLKLKISKNGKPATPDFGDPNVDTSAYDRYQAALKKAEEEYAAMVEQQKAQLAEDADDAATNAVYALYRKNRGDWTYDPKADVKAIKKTNKEATVTQTDLEDLYASLQAQYDYDDAAYAAWNRTTANAGKGVAAIASMALQRAKTTQDQKATAVKQENDRKIAEQAARKAENKAAFAALPMDYGIDNEQPWEYDSGKAYEAYWAAVDAGDMNAAKTELNDLRDKKAAQMQQLGRDTKYVINQAVQGIGDVVSGLARGAAWLYSGISLYNPGMTMSYEEAQALNAQGVDPFSLEYRRQGDKVLDTLLYISESSGSGPLNENSTAGSNQASDAAKFIGGLFRSGTSSLTAGSAGAALGSALPGLEKTISLNKVTKNAPKAVQVISKAVPDVTVGVASMPFMVQCFSSGYYEAKAEGYDENTAEVWGLYSAFAEGLPEAVSWNISATAGSSIKSKIYGGVSETAAKSSAKNGVKRILDNYGAQKTLNVIMTIAKAANSEGMEEIASNYLEYAGRKWILQQDAALPTAQENLTSYASGALLSLMGQGFSYATTSKAYKQAKQMLDDAANGNPPSAPQAQELIDACNEEAIKTPLSNAELNRMDAQGLKVDEGVVAKYRAANDALSGAEQRIANGLQQLAQMNAQGISPAEPVRKQVVDDIVKARAEITGLQAKRDAAHARYVQALDGMAATTEQAMEQTAQQRAQSDAAYGQWQVEELLKTDPRAVADAAAEMEAMCAQEIERVRQQLFVDGGRMDTRAREAMMQRMKQLEESVVKLSELRTTANTQFDVRMRQDPEGTFDALVAAEEAARAAGQTERVQQIQQLEQQVLDYAASDKRGQIEGIPRQIELLRNAKRGVKSKRKLADLDAQINALQAQYDAYFTPVGMTEPMEAPRREARTNEDNAQPTAEPLTIPDETQNGETGTNTPPEVEASVQGEKTATEATPAQQLIDQYRAYGATDEQIAQMARGLLDDADSEPSDIELAKEILDKLGQGNRSIAQRYIEANGSRARDSRVTDLLNIARQEASNGNAQAADEAGLEAAREILRGTAQPADPSIAAMKEQLRRLGIVPTAEERANIAATYGSYDAYRRAVAGVVPLGGQNKAGQSIDQAIGELADSFPGQVTGDDRVKWLYDFARNNPAGAITYDGDLDADARSLWEQIRSENADYFSPAAQPTPGFDVPDFSQPNVKYGKAAASEWLRNTLDAGTDESAVLSYARDKSVTALTGKERAFWDNVQQAAQNKNPTRQAFKPTQEEQAANDTARLFDKTSPYASASTTNMKHERSTRQERRKLASIRRDIQQLLGFSYSDEHFSRTERKAGAAAYYEPKHHFIASDDANNIDAFLHEAGHAARMQQYDADEIAAFKATMPKNFLDAYPEAAQNGEAAAEMFRAWMLNPELMERTYYNTFAQMRETIGNRKYSRLRDQGNSVRKWMDDSTQQRVAAIQRTRAEQEKSENKFVQAVKSFVNSSVDYEYGYRKLDRAMQRNGITLASSTSARASCARTSSEAINALMYDGMFDPETGERVYCSFTETAKGLIKTEDDVERLNVYLELKQSLDRYEANKKDWGYSKDVCTPVEAKAFVETVEAEHRNVAQAAENIWNWLKKYRDTQLSSAISTETLEKWEKLNPHYIPQTRVFTNNIKRAAKGGIGGQNSGVNRRQVGSTRDYLSPMDAIVDMVMRTKTAAMKHETLVTLQQYYDEDANGIAGQFLHEVEPGITVETVNGEAVKRAVTEGMENAEMDEDAINTVNELLENTNPEAKVYHVGVKDGKTGNVIAITVDGNTRYFEVLDQDLMDAIAPMKKVQLQGIFGAISKCTRFVNSLITSNNIFFAMPNAVKDYVTGYITGSTQNPFKYAGDYIKAAGDVITNREVYQQYKAMGGGGGLSQSFARASDINDVTSAMFKKAGDSRNLAKRWADGFMDKIEAINGGIDAVPRLAEYKRQLAMGKSFAEAIKAAKEVTTDFSVSGTHSPIYSMLWRFYGANVNSTYKQINNIADAAASGDRGRIARQAAAGASVMALTIALNLLNHMHDDETNYDALPDYIKEKYWVFPTKEKGKFIRIPKPNDLMPTEWIMAADHVSNVLVGIEGGEGTGEAIGREALDYVTDLLQAINPFGEANEGNPVGSNFTLNPLIQVFTNTSWTGAPIVSASLEDLSPELQYNERTSHLARFIGSVVGMSPQKVDFIINQNSGVIGEVKDAISAGVSKGITYGPVAGGLAFGKELLFSRFLIDSAYSEQVTSAYYDQRELLSTFISDVDETMERDRLPYSPQLKGLNPQQTQAAYTQAKALDKQLGALTKQLSALSQMATRAANDGDEEKAREYRFKRQELAAEGSLHIAEFYDRWKQVK